MIELTFSNCPSLRKIELPDSIVKIGDYLFNDCTSLEYCHYPINSKITEIKKNSFENCSSLTELPLTKYVTSLGSNTFRKCISLSGHLDLSRITSMGSGGFYGCQGIESVDITSLETVPYEAFRGCISLKSVEFSRKTRNINNSSFQNTIITSLNLSHVEEITIGEAAFSGLRTLNKINLPNNSTLNYRCFADTGIQGELYIPASWVFISTGHFSNCSELTYIEVEEGRTSIPQGFISWTIKADTIIFPSTITEIGDSFLHGNGWYPTFICKAIIPPVITGTGYIGYGPFSEMYVPDESVEAYKAAPSWSNHASQIKPMSMLANSNM